MLVSDLGHFLDLADDVPSPARNLATQLCAIVRAATAGKAGASWETALACRRRPGRQRCPGHIEVYRADLPAPITWHCTACADEGVISGWEGSYADLRPPRGERATRPTKAVVISDETAAALRDLQILDSACERLVYQARATELGFALPADADDVEELLEFLAAEANHETNRPRQKRLDAAFTELAEAAESLEADVLDR